jgi:mono/diheme cytochrome c family protein
MLEGIFTMRRAIRALICLATLAAISHALAQSTGDSNVGLATAQQVCSQCHATEKGQVLSPNSSAPTFVDLAAASGMTGTALMVALTTPHAGMPMFRLTTEEREGIVAYILSLRQ